MIETRGVVHFTIPVTDPENGARSSTRDVLGLETVQVVPPIGMVFMKSGDDHVILTRSKTPVDPNPGDEFLIHHAFRVDVDAYDDAKRHLAEHGVEIIFEEETPRRRVPRPAVLFPRSGPQRARDHRPGEDRRGVRRGRAPAGVFSLSRRGRGWLADRTG